MSPSDPRPPLHRRGRRRRAPASVRAPAPYRGVPEGTASGRLRDASASGRACMHHWQARSRRRPAGSLEATRFEWSTIRVDADLGLMSSLGQATQAHQRRTLELRGSWYDFSILSKTRIVDCAPITPLHPKPLFNNGLQFGLGTGAKDRRFRQREGRCVVASNSAATYVEAAHNSRHSKAQCRHMPRSCALTQFTQFEGVWGRG